MIVLTADNLGRLPHVAHGFFTRNGGVSQGIYASLNCGPGSDDAREAVVQNRRSALSTLANGGHAQLVTLYQIHGAGALRVGEPWPIDSPPEADAMATRVPGLALGILTADCAPVLLADEEAGVVGAAHAGWRGALSGVIESAVAAMEELGARRAQIAAAIGPCISRRNYEVDEGFRTRFVDAARSNDRFFEAAERPAHWRFDLEAYVAECLGIAGVDNLSRLGVCTYARETEFFSYRRNTHRGERDYGRQISAIMLKT